MLHNTRRLYLLQSGPKEAIHEDYLPIDESTLETDTWFRHPTKLIQVNEHGTHVRDIQNDKFLEIHCYKMEDLQMS